MGAGSLLVDGKTGFSFIYSLMVSRQELRGVGVLPAVLLGHEMQHTVPLTYRRDC